MTKKHFEMIAEILRQTKTENRYDRIDIIWAFAARFAEEFPRFDRGKFISAACMPEE